MTAALPPLNEEQLVHQQRVKQHINSILSKSGHVSFFDFMNQVLYAPGLGYYQAGSHKFGEHGDFVTAPELSPLFGWALANQCAHILRALGNGCVLEFGAGSGQLALDVLRRLRELDQLPEQYCIVEISADLVERQRQTLAKEPELLQRVTWLSALPENFVGVVLANEVLDAMPIELFCWHEDQVHRGLVGALDQQWQMLWQVQSKEWLPAAIQPYLDQWPQPYLSEFNPMLASWVEQLYLSMRAGVVLLIDYGFPACEYYHSDRQQGTLMCHYRHYAHTDPLIYPGLQDITAHVDFSAVAHAASDCGFAVSGFASQANFLLACDILGGVSSANQQQSMRESQQLQTLLMPAEMGELFKVMALNKAYDEPLLGFAKQDQRHRL